MVLIDADMIVTRPLAELIERAAERPRRRVREQPRPLRARVGRAARPRRARRRAPTSPRASSSLGGELGGRGAAPARRSPAPRSTSSAPGSARDEPGYPFLYPRPGRAQRDPRHAVADDELVVALDPRSRRIRPIAGCGSPTRRRCAARTRTAPSPTSSTSTWQALADTDVPRRLLAACCAACWLGDDVAVSSPRLGPLRMRRAGGRRSSASAVDVIDLARWHGAT